MKRTSEPQKSRRPLKAIFGAFDDFVDSLFDKVLVGGYRLYAAVFLVGLALFVGLLCMELFNFLVNTKNVS